eukprot:3809138-Alexandrium_andersonii.AAC.1
MASCNMGRAARKGRAARTLAMASQNGSVHQVTPAGGLGASKRSWGKMLVTLCKGNGCVCVLFGARPASPGAS